MSCNQCCVRRSRHHCRGLGCSSVPLHNHPRRRSCIFLRRCHRRCVQRSILFLFQSSLFQSSLQSYYHQLFLSHRLLGQVVFGRSRRRCCILCHHVLHHYVLRLLHGRQRPPVVQQRIFLLRGAHPPPIAPGLASCRRLSFCLFANLLQYIIIIVIYMAIRYRL